MIPLNLASIIEATGGSVLGSPAGPDLFSAVSIDSREIPSGCLFIAVRGERFDAHDFLPQVAAAGAGAAIIDRPEMAKGLNIPCIIVPDTRKALGRLASHVRRRLSSRVIAIGGSNGKTTTKHLVGSVLASALRGTQSPKSFNNDIGVPLTILGVSPADDYVILELGTNHPGELAPLSMMAMPDIAAITSIGPEHLEGFGDLAGVRREELTLLDGLVPDGLCIANADDPELPPLARARARRVITFGFAPDSDLRIREADCTLEGIRFRIAGCDEEYSLPLPGRHNAANALVAIAIGREMGLSDAAIRQALASCSRPEMRMQVMRLGQYTILNDAYNANPASMLAALETIASADVPGRRIAVLGDMRELGAQSAALHRQIGTAAAGSSLAILLTVGVDAEHLADAAIAAGMSADTVVRATDALQAAKLLTPILRPSDTILLKGSRGMRLERVVSSLAEMAPLPDAH